MNRTKLKNYAPQARRDFIQAVTDRAAFFGLTADKVEPVTKKGDSVLIGGKVFTPKVGEQRKRLEERVRQHGFTQTMEALAYTWFNRLVAIRFMELHDYLENGEGGASYRVLSNPDKDKLTPEILEKAELVTLEMLDREKVVDLKLDGTKEVELYRLLLIAECNALNSAMPFLFERIDDETELVLPDNLLHSDSLIRKLVNEIDEEAWQKVEIIGWLYEYYISERYEAVIGKVVASEDIPAATQRFTPNWIVKYLVQNTLGRQWLATYPQSALLPQMAYYIEPAEQTPEVQEQLKAITPTSLNPEQITLLDPACGSGHILVEAYELFKAIYQERGYRAKDIPRLILQKNLFGLEIDDRAAQLAAFALLMKARADDRHLFHVKDKVQPHVFALIATRGLNSHDLTQSINEPVLTQELPPSGQLFEREDELFSKKNMAVAGDLSQANVAKLIELFEDAKTFGSLIQIPAKLAATLPIIEKRVGVVAQHGEGFIRLYATNFLPVIEQAKVLAGRFDCVVANPPYMSGQYFSGSLKSYVAKHYKEAKADLYACFIERNGIFAKPNGLVGMITIPNWMCLSSFEEVRKVIFSEQTIDTFIHNGRGVFGSDFGTCSFTIRNYSLPSFQSIYRRLYETKGDVNSNEYLDAQFGSAVNRLARGDDLRSIPGSPVAYWASKATIRAFSGTPLSSLVESGGRCKTHNDGLYLRAPWEVDSRNIGIDKRWRFYDNGGKLRKHYGSRFTVIDWSENAREFYKSCGGLSNPKYWAHLGVAWTDIKWATNGFRVKPADSEYSSLTPCVIVLQEAAVPVISSLLNSVTTRHFLGLLNDSLHTNVGDVLRIPLPPIDFNRNDSLVRLATELIDLARQDWDSFETSWDFQALPILRLQAMTLRQSQEAADAEFHERFHHMERLEEENNRRFIEFYGLQGELLPEVPTDHITMYRPDREEDVKRLLSYTIGCMMGRYSLDKPALIYAHSGNVGFDPCQYKTFPADEDGIVPLLDTDWGIADDAASRVVEFIGVAWPKEHLEENLKFIADGLGPTKNEHSRDTIRRYLAIGSYKDHLRWYKRRPIYWLFSSGKQRAFQCLVYLHRYHEGTLARMRTEYVIPLQGKIAARIEQLEGDKTKATSTSHGRKLQKEQDDLKKKQTELFAFDEKLKHAADKKITLDLDDGVKVNYGKFGDLLAEVKAVTGGKDEE